MEIQIQNLTKKYGEKIVWRDFNMKLPLGGSLALMGASGCGKTTLLRILMGLERQDAGAVFGVPEKISAVFQENRLCQELDAITNVRLVMPKHTGDAMIREHLTRLGLGDSLQLSVEQLSGGMKRRVAIARAYLAPSQMIFLDEPLQGLDEDTKAAVIDWMKEMRQNRTLLLVTHDKNEALALADTIWYMTEKGELLKEKSC